MFNKLKNLIEKICKKRVWVNPQLLCEYMYNHNAFDNKNEFVNITESKFERKADDTKLIAFYLPQYHAVEVNDKSYGKGFTDWLNTSKTLPQFVGHNQPHLPYDVGFYDLSHDDVMYRQIELAKMYGLYGFCFHYYWFPDNKRILEKPVFNYLKNKELKFPYCLCWANESWATLWDKGKKEIIMEQNFQERDFKDFFNGIIDFFKDERYIKINNKPLLIIYKVEVFAENILRKFIEYLKENIKLFGFDGIYLLTTNTFIYDPELAKKAIDIGFDATMEFPPHGIFDGGGEGLKATKSYKDIKYYPINKKFNGAIINMHKVISEKAYDTNAKFKCVFPSWDNTARKCNTGCSVMQVSIDDYKIWLEDCIKCTKKNNSKEEQIVFINAWNEWAEGAHLEPDTRYGYAYLQATKDVLEKTRS